MMHRYAVEAGHVDRPRVRLTASSLSHRGVICLTAHENGWSRIPSKFYGSPVCAFGAPQASGFGTRELIAPRAPGSGSPVKWHCPFVDA